MKIQQETSMNIRVLVVDDSTFIRNTISSMLNKSPEINVVGVARNGEEALRKIDELNPDVMTLDVDMPGMNGLQVLEKVMGQHPLPVLMVSSLTEESAKETVQALELGAFDFISKRLNGSVLQISKIEDLLLNKVKAAACSGGKIHGFSQEMAGSLKKKQVPASLRNGKRLRTAKLKKHQEKGQSPTSVVIIGSSTGGPKVIQQILSEFPSTLESAVIVIQHMPKFFTKPFAERLNQLCALEVYEAKDEELLQTGKILVAPGSHHLRLEKNREGEIGVRISTEPNHLPYQPSVDLAMESAVQIFESSVVGVVLTGMGNDGERGMEAIKAAGGQTIAQNEATCIVYGMPKAVVDGGHADAVVPISQISAEILHRIQQIPQLNSHVSMKVHGEG